jgi:hypothetical protein
MDHGTITATRWSPNTPAESGAGDEVIMSIAGHVSRALLSRYSHIRMEAKWRVLGEIAARQRAADEKRQAETQRREAATVCLGLGQRRRPKFHLPKGPVAHGR